MGGQTAVLRPASVVGSFDGAIGAYLHVPFCSRICPFCPYNKVIARGDQPQRYFRALSEEVDRYLDAGAPGPGGFSSLYVGGGTPTLFQEQVSEILARIPVVGERAIEVLPTHATARRMDALRAAGFTAVSIGAQSFQDGVLRRLGRPHDGSVARAAVRAAVGRFELVDVDLIVDVELDDELSGAFLGDLRECFEMGADQVSTYPLMRFGYTPFGRARHDRRREHEVLARAEQVAGEFGYERRSVWTFNRRDSASYTSITRRRFLGMGAGAASFAGRDYYVNHFGVQTYIDAVEHGSLPIARWLHLGRVGGAAYDIFWQAYAGRVKVGERDQPRGAARSISVRAGVSPLVAVGLLEPVDGGYGLTARGFSVYHDLERLVTYQLIEPLWAQMLVEHAAEGASVPWASPDRGRRSWAWRTACRVMERPVAPQGAAAQARGL